MEPRTRAVFVEGRLGRAFGCEIFEDASRFLEEGRLGVSARAALHATRMARARSGRCVQRHIVVGAQL
jgi:hypothetical protein